MKHEDVITAANRCAASKQQPDAGLKPIVVQLTQMCQDITTEAL